IDLVEEQNRLAAGETLSFRQVDGRIRGNAIECRSSAEDHANDFIPSTGKCISYRQPAGPGGRVDSGVRQDSEITPYYDSLISKIITYGATRQDAIRRMAQALAEYRIAGVITNIGFHETVMQMPAFHRGELSTSYIADNFPNGISNEERDLELVQ